MNTVRIYSNDIKMEFDIKKCEILIMKNGRHHKSEDIELASEEKIKE